MRKLLTTAVTSSALLSAAMLASTSALGDETTTPVLKTSLHGMDGMEANIAVVAVATFTPDMSSFTAWKVRLRLNSKGSSPFGFPQAKPLTKYQTFRWSAAIPASLKARALLSSRSGRPESP